MDWNKPETIPYGNKLLLSQRQRNCLQLVIPTPKRRIIALIEWVYDIKTKNFSYSLPFCKNLENCWKVSMQLFSWVIFVILEYVLMKFTNNKVKVRQIVIVRKDIDEILHNLDCQKRETALKLYLELYKTDLYLVS